ncbi:competence protein CoiA [Cytobacillus depressus]|uniref:competence protein CoiA n=1 Tax=Cytobacillus depressus TaxID=1602942 RepID=UPI0014797F4C|nr:competence protein CoiA family protein [Cytobacillus depressus]
MLVSKTKQGNLLNVTGIRNLDYLRAMRRTESFFCPECDERVILKVGTKKMPHFAHQKGSACSESYERESEYHLKGKIALFEWLQEQGVESSLESFDKKIAQRPDIGFNFEGARYAIEYQCSSIPEELFIKRTENYFNANITPIWIMAGKNIKRPTNNRVALSKFDFLFLANSHSGMSIPSYCPIMNTLIIVQRILPVSVKNSLAHFSIKSLTKASITDLIRPTPNRPNQLNDWLKEIRRAKNITIPYYQSTQNKFLQELYSHSIIPSMLPPEIGLPVAHAHFIETPALEWQSYLLIDLLNRSQPIPIDKIIYAFKRRVGRNEIKLRNLPLARRGNALLAVKAYMKLLVKLNIFQAVSQTHIKRINPIRTQNNVERQLEWETNFYRKNFKIINDGLK